MFVRYVRAIAVSMTLAWTGGALAQSAFQQDTDEIGALLDSEVAPTASGEDTYIADPSESFIVEHPVGIAAEPPRAALTARAPDRVSDRCRTYRTDNGAYGRGLACPQSDGSWRIVSGSDERAGQADDESYRAPAYTQDERDTYEKPQRARRFRLDWDDWSARRGAPERAYRYRYDE